MKAFLLSVVAVIVISGAAALILENVDSSSSAVYQSGATRL